MANSKIGDRVRYSDLSLGLLDNYQGTITPDIGNGHVRARFIGRQFDSTEFAKNLVPLTD